MSFRTSYTDGLRRFLAKGLRGVARRIDTANTWAFLDARQAELGNVPPLDISAVIAAYFGAKGQCQIVQVGANSGNRNDPVEASIRNLGLTAILVEPQAEEFAKLTANYADQPQVVLERAAIAWETGEVELFKVNADFWSGHGFPEGAQSQISSLNREQIGQTVEIFGGSKLREAESAYLEIEVVPAFPLEMLLEKHGLGTIDLLVIDTEGFDFEILRMIDWDRLQPAMIHYETIHLAIPERVAAWTMLCEKGYRLFATDNHNTIAINVTKRTVNARG